MHVPRFFLVVAFLAAPAFAQDHAHATDQPYAGLQDREIKSLSQDDIAQLRTGAGWGLALPAELNGKPGPAHLLELREALALTEDQVAAITAIHDAMKAEAVAAGSRLIEAERALSEAFAGDDLTQEQLAELLNATEDARRALRFIHLATHLETPPLLSAAQLRQYSVLRGYSDDPCAKVPEGHDPEMWKQHNGCS